MAFCAHTILGRDPFIVEEADADERFLDHPWVIAPPAVRFYAGVPLLTDDGHAIGSLAVMDVVPRTLTPEQRAGVREHLSQMKDLHIVGEGGSVAEALALAQTMKPDLMVLDLSLPDGSGVQACRQVLERMPALRVIIMSIHGESMIVRAALEAGACGYLLKDVAGEQLLQAIRTVLDGQAFLQPCLVQSVLNELRSMMDGAPSRGLASLSPQERRILPLLAEGKTNKEIGVELTLSDKTVKNYLANMFAKLQVTNRASAAALYARRQQQEGAAGGVCL